MAWTEQCKHSFSANTRKLLHDNKGRGLVRILRHLSKESGISYPTLRRWWYDLQNEPEENVLNNEKKSEDAETTTETTGERAPTCKICGELAQRRTGKKEGQYYSWCRKCRRYKDKSKCPECGYVYDKKLGRMVP